MSCAKPLPRSATGARCAYEDFSGAAGVFVTDLRLQSLADFLRTQVISSRGAAYLVDEAGLLVASSAGDALYQSLPGGLEHVKPAESNNPVERASCAALQAVLRQKSSHKVLVDGFVDRSVSLQCREMADGDALITVRRPLCDALRLRWTLLVESRTAGLLASREEALQAAKAKASFLATVGQEMRTPLNGVLGMRTLMAETRLDNEQSDHLQPIPIRLPSYRHSYAEDPKDLGQVRPRVSGV